MIILIPMAGAGSRFVQEGYAKHKPAIPTTDRRTGKKVPMVVAATMDLPSLKNEKDQLIYIDRDFHHADGVESEILGCYPNAKFITINYLTEGQASTCLLAKNYINNNQELIIAGCDNGMVMDTQRFKELKKETDALIFTYRNHELVLIKPEAHGWAKVDSDDNLVAMSVKKPISNNPLNDHAVVATFWFKKGSDFVNATERMIQRNDRVNGEFYVDQVMQHALELGLKVKVFEIQRYIGWGTPKDYEDYENTIQYWRNFYQLEKNNII